jgi:hypothetical protein
VLVVSQQVTAFPALQAVNILVVILAMNQAVAAVVITAAVVVEITAVVAAAQVSLTRALSLTTSHLPEH